MVGGSTLLDRVLAAVAGAQRRIVVGPKRAAVDSALFVQDEQSGPVAAIALGLTEATAPVVVTVAADLAFLLQPHVVELVAALRRVVREGVTRESVAVALDDNGRRQLLLAAWDTASLRSALVDTGGVDGSGLPDARLGALFPAVVREVRLVGDPAPWLDCDTPEQLEMARRLA